MFTLHYITLCSAGRPSGWALAHILVVTFIDFTFYTLADLNSDDNF